MPEQTSHARKWEWWEWAGPNTLLTAALSRGLAVSQQPRPACRLHSGEQRYRHTHTHPHGHVKGVQQAELGSQATSHAKASSSTPANRRGQEPPHPPSSEDKPGRMSEGLGGGDGWWWWGNQQAALKCKNVLQAWSERGTECERADRAANVTPGTLREGRRLTQTGSSARPAELTTVCRFHEYGQ